MELSHRDLTDELVSIGVDRAEEVQKKQARWMVLGIKVKVVQMNTQQKCQATATIITIGMMVMIKPFG